MLPGLTITPGLRHDHFERDSGGRDDGRDVLTRGDRLGLPLNGHCGQVDDLVDPTVGFGDFSTGRFNPATGNFAVGLRGTVARGIDAGDVPEGALTTGGFAAVDLLATWQPAAGPLEGAAVSAGIDNLLDRDYRVHPSGLDSPGSR